jgi:hypothetical protein
MTVRNTLKRENESPGASLGDLQTVDEILVPRELFFAREHPCPPAPP